jgi:hypothetical protein
LATPEAQSLIESLTEDLYITQIADQRHDSYFEGSHRLRRFGIAVPSDMSYLETVVNWPRLVVESVEERCDVKSFIHGGDELASSDLRELWDANNLDSEFHLTFLDSLVFGRGFLSIGSNEDDPDHPLIVVESPMEMVVRVDPRQRRVLSALKLYGDSPIPTTDGTIDWTAQVATPKYATLYEPDRTTWFDLDGDQWVESDRDDHKIGRVPVVPFFNRRRSGRWIGISEMADAISLTDAACRALTNLQVAMETHSVPQRYALGLSKGDFVDQDGKPLPVWQAYFGAIWSTQNKDAKVGQFQASDLRNFHETTSHYAQLVAGLYGLPMRYMGQNTANPPSADGIRADEARLIKRAERKMSAVGDQLGRVMAYALRIRDKQWPETGDRIKVEWHDAATPTYAAKVDGIQKLTGGKPILSRQGGWDELGWSDARKEREIKYLAEEASDPLLQQIANNLANAGAAPVTPNAAASGG